MAGCGSVDIMNWDAVMHLGFSSNPAAGCLAVASQPATWVVGASWIAAAGLYSLLCVRGTRAFDIAGSVMAAVVLMFGACAAAISLPSAARGYPLRRHCSERWCPAFSASWPRL